MSTIDRTKPIDFTTPGDWWKEEGLIRTRDGRKVRIYATNATAPFSVHGAIFTKDEWRMECWMIHGEAYPGGMVNPKDLVYAPRRIKRDVWVNIHGDRFYLYYTKEDADKYAGNGRLACVKVGIDCAEGEGFETTKGTP